MSRIPLLTWMGLLSGSEETAEGPCSAARSSFASRAARHFSSYSVCALLVGGRPGWGRRQAKAKVTVDVCGAVVCQRVSENVTVATGRLVSTVMQYPARSAPEELRRSDITHTLHTCTTSVVRGNTSVYYPYNPLLLRGMTTNADRTPC